MESIVRIENKSIQRKSRNYPMNTKQYEYFVPKIIKAFELLKDDIVFIEEMIL